VPAPGGHARGARGRKVCFPGETVLKRRPGNPFLSGEGGRRALLNEEGPLKFFFRPDIPRRGARILHTKKALLGGEENVCRDSKFYPARQEERASRGPFMCPHISTSRGVVHPPMKGVSAAFLMSPRKKRSRGRRVGVETRRGKHRAKKQCGRPGQM